MSLWASGGIFALVFLAAGQTQPDPTHAAMADIRAGKYEDARSIIQSGLKQTPQDSRLWTLDGLALARMGKKRESLSSYERALAIAPDYLAALEGAAEMAYQLRSPRAVPVLRHLLELKPNDETAHGMLAAIAFNAGDCQTAVEEFGLSQAVIASQVIALQEYGSCLVKLKRPEEAIPIFKWLTELQPNDEKARYNLAVVDSLAGHYSDVIAILQQSGAERPRGESLDLLAEAYEAIGNTPKAVATLREAIVANPATPKYYLDFANLCLTHAAYQVGIDMLNAGLGRMPDSAPLFLARGVLYIQLGEYDKSERDFANAERLNSHLEAAADARGLAELQRNDLSQAETTIAARLRAQPNNAFLNYLMAETLVRRGTTAGTPEFNKAVMCAEKAVRIQNDFALARDVLSRLYLQQGKVEEAIQQSRRAIAEDPSDQTAVYHLILALRKANRTSEVPELSKKLAALREQARVKEAEERKYEIVEVKPQK